MARRSAHTPEELRQKILDAAQAIIEHEGLMGLSAHEIARAIGYSPGTLYNIFENLDDVLLTLQTNMLQRVLTVLQNTAPADTAEESIKLYAKTYLAFALENKFMWNLLFTHNMPQNTKIPIGLIDNISKVSRFVQDAVARLMPSASTSDVEIAAKSLWAGVHGITAVAVTEKGPSLNPATAHIFVNHLVTTYIRGLHA